MQFEDFKQLYVQTSAAIQQTHIAALIASTALANFPHRLPEPTKSNVLRILTELSDGLDSVRSELFGESHKKVAHLRLASGGDPSIPPLINMMLTLGMAGKDLMPDFRPLLFAQDLVTTLAHVDGFTADVLRTICRCKPEILRRQKQVSWETLIDAGSWDGVMSILIETHVLEFGWKTLSDRINAFEQTNGLSLPPQKEALEVLEGAYQVRHILVHNGGRVSREFLNRTARSDVQLGEQLAVTPKYASQVSSAALLLASDLFASASRKFFKATPKDFVGVLQRRKTAKDSQP